MGGGACILFTLRYEEQASGRVASLKTGHYKLFRDGAETVSKKGSYRVGALKILRKCAGLERRPLQG